MSRWKRFSIGVGITVVALGGLTALWYPRHYTLPVLVVEDDVALPHPNSFDTLQAAMERAVWELPGVSVTPKLEPGYLTVYQTQPLKARFPLAKANRDSIALTRQALKQEYRTPPHTNMTRLGMALRKQTQLLVFAGEAYGDAGNQAEATRCFLDAMDLGVTVPQGGDLLSYFYGTTCEAMGAAALHGSIDRLDATTAQEVLVRLAQIEQKRPSFRESVWAQRRNLEREMRTLFTENPFLTWKHVGASFQGLSSFHAATVPDTGAFDSSFDNRMRKLVLQAVITYQGPTPTIAELNRQMNELEGLSGLPWGSAERQAWKEQSSRGAQSTLLSEMLSMAYGGMEFYGVKAQASLALLQTRLRLRIVYLETGRYPATLSHLPEDPFSPTRAPLQYRSDGKTFTLWSVGPNAKDNEGKPVPLSISNKKRWTSIGAYDTGDIVG